MSPDLEYLGDQFIRIIFTTLILWATGLILISAVENILNYNIGYWIHIDIHIPLPIAAIVVGILPTAIIYNLIR